MIVKGHAHEFGDDVDTDAIISARYMDSADPRDFAPHCMESLDPGFAGRVRPGDVLFCGENFGCGSSREHAPLAIRGLGAGCLVGKSFARIFYRNSYNVGLPLLICAPAVDAARAGDRAEVDLDTGAIRVGDREFLAEPVPEFMQTILAHGGLLEYLRANTR